MKDKQSFVHETANKDLAWGYKVTGKKNIRSMIRLFTMICLDTVVYTLFILQDLTRYARMHHDEVGGVFQFSGNM